MTNTINIDQFDTLNEWRQKFNLVSSYVGALENLQVPDEDDSSQYSSIVSAINTINSKLNPTLINLLSDNVQNSSVNQFSYDSMSGIVTFISRDILDSDIGTFDAALFTSGKVDERRIQGLDGSILTSGVLDAARLPAAATIEPFSISSTDELPEGATNKYFKETKVRISFSIDSTDYISFNNSTGEIVWEYGQVDSAPVAGTGVTINSNEVSIGQDVGAASDVSFSSVVVSGQISAASVSGDMISNFSQAVGGTASTVMMTPKTTVQNSTKNFNDNLKYAEKTVPLSNGQVTTVRYDFEGQGTDGYFDRTLPDFVELELVCKTAEHGWGEGDTIRINPGAALEGGNVGIAFVKNARLNGQLAFKVLVGENGPGEYGEGNSGRGFSLTASNWELKVRMMKFVNSSLETNDNASTAVF